MASKGTKLKLIAPTGEKAKALRLKLGLTQMEFWGRVRVTQSGGCRYESGRDMPKPVSLLLHLVYGTEAQAHAALGDLRSVGHKT